MRLEEELREPVAAYFRTRGFRVHAEVRFRRRWIDILAVNRETTVAVELKLRDWRQALRQAVAYQLACPWAFVALPFPRVFAAYRQRHLFEREGVGLLVVRSGGGVRVILEPELSPRLMPSLHDAVFSEDEGGTPRPRSTRRLPRRPPPAYVSAYTLSGEND
jgi:hypothetical protein